MLLAQLNRNVFSSGNRSQGEMFFRSFLLVNLLERVLCSSQRVQSSRRGEVLRSEKGPRKKDPLLLCSFSLFIWKDPFIFLFGCHDDFASHRYFQLLLYLLSVMLSCFWNGPPDVWLWVDWWQCCGRDVLSVVIRAEVAIHSARSSYMPFIRPLIWIKDLFSLLQKVTHKCVGRLRFVTLRAPCLGSQDLVIFITCEVNPY